MSARSRSAAAAVLAATCAACGSGDDGGPTGDPCVDQPTTAIQLVDTKRIAYPGEPITIRWRIDSRDTDGVLVGAAGEASIDGPGVVVEHTDEYLAWIAGMEHGEFQLKVGRAGCAEDFILDHVVVEGPDLDPVTSEPANISWSDAVAWSPDSARLAVASQDLLRVYDVDGDYVRGTRTSLLGGDLRMAWSADGTWIVVAGDDGPDRGPLLVKAERLTPWTRFLRDVGHGAAFDATSRWLYVAEAAYDPNGTDVFAVHRMDLVTGASNSVMQAFADFLEPPFDLETDALGQVFAAGLSMSSVSGVRLRKYTCEDDSQARAVAPDDGSGLVYVLTDRYLCAVQPATGHARLAGVPAMVAAKAVAVDPLGEGVIVVGQGCDGSPGCAAESMVVYRGSLGDPENLVVTARTSLGWLRDVAWSPDGAYVALAVDHAPGFVIIPRAEIWTHGATP